MKTIFKLFKIFLKKNFFLFFITSLMILLSSIFTIFQAEAGQAFFSIINQISFQKGVSSNNGNIDNKNEILDFKNFLIRILKAGSIDNAVKILVESRNLFYVFLSGIFIIFIFLLYEVFFYLQNSFSGLLGLEVSLEYLNKTFNKLLYLPSVFYKGKGHTGDILSRLTNDIQNIRTYSIYILVTLFSTPVLVIFSIFMLLKKSLKFTLAIIILGLIAFLIINLISKIIKKFATINMQKVSKTTDYINKTIYGIDIIKIFNKSDREKENFNKELKEYKKSFASRFFLEFSIRPLTELIGSAILVSVLLVGIYLIWQGRMSIEKIFGFIIYLVILSPKANELSSLFSNIKILEASIERIEEILNLENEDIYFGKEELKNFSGEIEFKNVSFSYHIFSNKINKDSKIKEKTINIDNKNLTKTEKDKDIDKEPHQLKNISFKINKNEFVAIVGPSGSGKSTIVNLISSLIYPTSGEILFDGINYQNYTLESIRKFISYVTQETILFPDTIYNNIAFGIQNTNLEEVIYYSKLAYAHDFISKLPEGYNTIIGERGAKLSGGEKQRIAIARALIKKPKVLIFDEATSNLDSESEKFISEAIDNISKFQTTIVIAHRLSTILKADKIIVLKDGEILDIGKHEELINRCEFYKKLFQIQFEI